MTNDEKAAMLIQWQTRMECADMLIEPVTECLGLSVESPIHQAVWALQAAYTKAVGKLVGDPAEWLSWYAHENDFGRKAYEAGVTGDMRPIKDLDDLLWVMQSRAATWCYSTNEEDYHGAFDSKEAAAMSATEALEDSGDHLNGNDALYWVAQAKPAEAFLRPDLVGDRILEELNESLADDIPSDGEPLCKLTPDEQAELGEVVVDFIRRRDGFKRYGVGRAERFVHVIGGEDGK
jgi:hypothetical protein